MKHAKTLLQAIEQVAGISKTVLSPDTERLLRRVLDLKPSKAQLCAVILQLSDRVDPTGTLAQRLTEILPRT